MKPLLIIVPLLFMVFSQCSKNTTEPDHSATGMFVVDTLTVTAQAGSLTGFAVTAHITYHFEGLPGSPDRMRLSVLDASASAIADFSSPIPVDTYTLWTPKITTNDPGTDSVLARFSVSGRLWELQGPNSALYGDFAWSDSQMVAIER